MDYPWNSSCILSKNKSNNFTTNSIRNLSKSFSGNSTEISLEIYQDYLLGIFADAYLCVAPDIQFFFQKFVHKNTIEALQEFYYFVFFSGISFNFLFLFLGNLLRIKLLQEVLRTILVGFLQEFLGDFFWSFKSTSQHFYRDFIEDFETKFLHPNMGFHWSVFICSWNDRFKLPLQGRVRLPDHGAP